MSRYLGSIHSEQRFVKVNPISVIISWFILNDATGKLSIIRPALYKECLIVFTKQNISRYNDLNPSTHSYFAHCATPLQNAFKLYNKKWHHTAQKPTRRNLEFTEHIYNPDTNLQNRSFFKNYTRRCVFAMVDWYDSSVMFYFHVCKALPHTATSGVNLMKKVGRWKAVAN